MANRKSSRRDYSAEGFTYATLAQLNNAASGGVVETMDGNVYTKLGNDVWLDDERNRIHSSDILSESAQVRLTSCA